MKNTISIMVLMFLGAVAHGALPEISDMTVTQDPETLRVTVTYALDRKAIVTANVYTNGVRVPGKELPSFIGDVNAAVDASDETTVRSFVWLPTQRWEGLKIDNEIRFELTAHPLETPPDYLVADLRLPHVRYFTCEDDLPDGGIGEDRYRMDYVVFRRIHAEGRSFTMGAAEDEPGWRESFPNFSRETLRKVSFTKDFWLAVFETTQYQWWRISGDWPSFFSNKTCRATRPVENLSYGSIRGTAWPTDGYDGAAGHLAVLRAVTGLNVDLPTEAQWEFACRAGTGTGLNNGLDVMKSGSNTEDARFPDAALDEIARYNGNGGQREDGTFVNGDIATTDYGTARVGSYRPNAWGLYDMHGNVGEYCLDYVNYEDAGHGMLPTTDTVDPTGPAYDADLNQYSARATRGGSFNFSSWCCRSAARRFQAPAQKNFGFRLAIQQ